MQALNGFLNCKTLVFLLLITAGMAELVDAYVSEAYAFTGVRVRLPLPALLKIKGLHEKDRVALFV